MPLAVGLGQGGAALEVLPHLERILPEGALDLLVRTLVSLPLTGIAAILSP